MSDEATRPSIPWEQVAAGAAALSAESRLAAMAARFLALVDSWATPSAVLCARRDPTAAEGASMIPELSSGSVTSVAERALAKLFTDYPPGTLTRPTLVRPQEESGAFKVRDTLIVPWAYGPELSGFLVLRGLPRPEPPNLGDAVALLAQPLWTRVAEGIDAAAPRRAAGAETLGERLGELRRIVDEIESRVRSEADAAGAERDEALAKLAAAEKASGERREAESSEAADAERQAREAAEKVAEESRKERDAAREERDKARAEAEELKGRLESLQGKLESEAARAAELLTRASGAESARDAAQAKAEAVEKLTAERDEALARLAAAETERAESQAKPSAPEPSPAAADAAASEATLESLRPAVEALRRTPFVPPTVRVLFDEAATLLNVTPAGRERRGRILLLDRDAPMLGGLAGELEQEGLDVLIAHYADEVSLFLKTPEGRDLTALVLDVLALRPDQNVVELVRTWRRDLPSLAVYLTFRSDNPSEAERAQRLPSSTTAGYIPRPLKKPDLLEAVTSQTRRATKK